MEIKLPESPEKSELEVLEEQLKQERPDFRQFCLEMMRDEIKRINMTQQRMKEVKQIYKKLKNKLIMGKRDEDSVVDIMSETPEFFDAYDKFAEYWENQRKVTVEKIARLKGEENEESGNKSA